MMVFLGTPFNKMDEQDDLKIRANQFLHCGLKFLCESISSRYSQEVESKAFEMSHLKRRDGVLVLW